MLPVADILPELLLLLKQHNKVVLSAPPGAGKSTYLPLKLLQHPDFANKKMLMLEPRRLAAKSIAAYIAKELGEDVGQRVGYQIRQETKQSNATRLLIVTEGVLTRKLQQDPELQSADLILFDEFHERSLHADLALALCLEVQELRPELQLLIMSATIDVALLSEKLGAPTLVSEGRSYPVSVEYVAPDNQPLAVQISKMVQLALQKHSGNILVFLPGQAEINQTAKLLAVSNLASNVNVHSLLGNLTLHEQQEAINPPAAGFRKVVLSTNLAETSLTIEGITVVIDSGLARQSRFNPKQKVSSLDTIAISQAAAIQRTGRAGRLSAGYCYRLDTTEKWQRRARFEAPEIDIADLTALRLEVAAWGCQVKDLNWLSTPPLAHLQVAESLLQQLGFLDKKGLISAKGKEAHQLGTDARIAALLLHGKKLEQEGYQNAAALACVLGALLEDTRVLKDDIYYVINHVKRLMPMQWQQAQQFARLLGCKITEHLPLELTPLLALRAYPDRLAKKRGQGYQLSSGVGASLFPDSALSGQPWLVVLSLQQFERENRIYHGVSIDVDALIADFKNEISWQTQTYWDEKSASFVSENQLKFGFCVLASKSASLQLSADQKLNAWVNYISNKGLTCLNWDDNALQLQARVQLMSRYQKEWPDFSNDALALSIENWLGTYLSQISKSSALAQIPVYDALKQQLSYAQLQLLNEHLPTHWQVPTGSKIAINYLAEGGARLSVRVQEMYGQMDSPRLMQGKITVTVELLSPSRQPLQVTQDLASFWQNGWHEARKEMRGRYPKHYWPEDPAQALPTTKTKKAMLR